MTILLALLLFVVLPGLAGGVVLTWSSTDPERVGSLLIRGLACGISAWLASSGLVERTVGITQTTSWTTGIVLAVLSVVVLALPRSRALSRSVLGALRYFAAVLVVSIMTWLPVGVLVLRTSWGPLGSTPWYYWSLASRIAQTGHVPSTTTEWGTTLPFLDDYHLFSTGTAMWLTMSGSHSVPVVHAVIVLSVIVLGCGAALLAHVLCAGRLASLAAVPVVIGTGIGALRLTSYRPEGFGLGLTLLVVACFIDWFRFREKGSLVAGCLLGAALAQVHGIALLSAAVFLVGSVLAFTPMRHRWAYVRRAITSAALLSASAVLLSLVTGSASGTEHVGGLEATCGLADPTWRFIRAIRGHPPSLPPDNRALINGAVDTIYKGTLVGVSIVVVAATLILVTAAVQRRRGARETLVFAAACLVGIGMVAAFFALGWSSYVPRRTGSQRLVPEATLLVGPYVACGVSCIPTLRLTAVGKRIVTCAVVVLLGVAGTYASARLERRVAGQHPSSLDIAALERLSVPDGAVVLTNAYTEGYVDQVIGATGLLEGRAPYTFPRVLARANRLLGEAHDFYRKPVQNSDFLATNHVDYVVVSRRHSYSLGTGNVFVTPRPPSALSRVDGLIPVLRTPDLSVYRVDRSVVELRRRP